MVSTSVSGSTRMDRRTKKKRQQSYGRANRFCHKPEHSARQGHNHGHGKLPVASSVRTHYKNAPHRSVFKRITPQQRFFCITRTNCRALSRSLSMPASLAGVPLKNNTALHALVRMRNLLAHFSNKKNPRLFPAAGGRRKKEDPFSDSSITFPRYEMGDVSTPVYRPESLSLFFSPAKRLSVEVPCF